MSDEPDVEFPTDPDELEEFIEEKAGDVDEAEAEAAAIDDHGLPPVAEQMGRGGPGFNPGQMFGMLQNGGIEEMMKQPIFPTEDGGKVSQAEVLADVINIYRIDAKMLGRLHGVDLSIEKITSRRVAWLLSELVEGNPGPLIDVFNGIEELHHDILQHQLTEEQFEKFKARKESQLYTHGNRDDSEE